MTVESLELLLKSKEGVSVEFKQSFPSKLSELATELCAFANMNGGVLLVGVNDKQQVLGVTLDNTQRSRIQSVINLIDPAISIQVSEQSFNGKTVLCFDCPAGQQKPYAVSGSIYVRNGPNSERIISTEQMRTFFQRSDSIFFDLGYCRSFNYPEDFDSARFGYFIDRAGISPSISERSILENLNLLTSDNLMTNAGVMFFAKDVQKHIDHAVVRCCLFKGNDKRFILDSKVMSGNLETQFEAALTFIISKLNLNYEIEGQPGGIRKEVLEIPETAFREALVNALCHRSYYDRGAVIMVEIYDNRVEISNPGGLVSAIAPSEFGMKSFSRNPLVSSLMQRISLVEKVGSGINRIRESLQEAELPAPKFEMGGFFTVIFYRPVSFDVWLRSWEPNLHKNMVKVLLVIHQDEKVTKPQIAMLVKQGKTMVDKHMTTLRKLGLLERVGSDKTGRWVIHQVPVPNP